MNAESAYVFRHALLRDAAYQLQLPGDRARLHGFALDVITALAGSPPPPGPLDPDEPAARPHPADPFAGELARHAALAGPNFAEARLAWLRRFADVSDRAGDVAAAAEAWLEAAGLLGKRGGAEARRRAAEMLRLRGRNREAEGLLEEALKATRDAGDARHEGIVLGSLANLVSETGRVPEAEEMLDRSVELLRRAGDRKWESTELANLGNLYVTTGRGE